MNNRTIKGIRRWLSFVGILSILSGLVVAIPTASAAYTGADAPYGEAQTDMLIDLGARDPMRTPDFGAPVTRDAACLMLANLFAAEAPAEYENPFVDVPDGAWYSDAVMACSYYNWFGGKTNSNGTRSFMPADGFTREQMAVVMHAMAGYEYPEDQEGTLDAYTDASKLSAWSKTAFAWAVEQGLLGAGTVANPQGVVNNIDTNVMVANFYEFVVDYDVDVFANETIIDPTPDPTPVGNVSVKVASTSPASSTLVAGQGTADLAQFSFMGTGTVTSLTFERLGVSANTTLSNVYLFNGSQRVTDSASVNSDGKVTFSASELFKVSGPMTLTVKSDIDTGTSGQTVGIRLSSVTVAGNSAMTVSLDGAIHTIAQATLAGVAFASATGSGNTDPGEDINVWQGTATVSTRDVTLNRLALRQIGSIVSGDIKNFKLYVDGVLVASTSMLDASGYVTFAPLTPITLKSGARVLKVQADVIGGSGRTVQMSLRGAYDVGTVDSSYKVDVKATGTFPFGPSAFTVNAGTMTVVKASASQADDLVLGATDQALATYTFTAYGEKIKVETLRVGMITDGTPTDVTIRNVRLMVNGGQVGSTTDVPAAATFAAASGTSFTTNFMVEPGMPTTVQIRGDIVDSEDNGADNDDFVEANSTTLQALLVGGTATSNAVPQVSLGTINVPSATNVLGNELAVSTGTLTLSAVSTYQDHEVVSPQTAYKIGSFNLAGNSTEAVNLNTFTVDFNGTVDAVDLADVYIVYGGKQTSVKGTVALSGNSWSITQELAKNATLSIDVFATLNASFAGAETLSVDLTVAGITVGSSTSVDDTTTGQELTQASGSIAVTKDASSPVAANLNDSGSVNTAVFKFKATNDTYTVTDITLTIPNVNAVSLVTLMDGATPLVAKPAGTTVTFSGLSISVAPNQDKFITTLLTLAEVTTNSGTGLTVTTTLTQAMARDSTGSSGGVSEPVANPAGNAMYVFKALPTITPVPLPTTVLNAGDAVVSKFTVATNGTGTMEWGYLAFVVTKNISGGADTLSSVTLWDADTNTEIAGTAAFTGDIDDATDTSGGITFTPDDLQQVSGSKTYELRLTIAGAPVSGDSFTVKIAQPSSQAAGDDLAAVIATTPSFAWSDQSALAHDETTTDWFNDFLVKNLPTVTQVMSR